MQILIDQLVLFILTLTLYLSHVNSIYLIIPVIIAIILSTLTSYFENEHITITLFVIYIIVSFFIPILMFFIPLISYNASIFKKKWIWFFSFLPLLIYLNNNPLSPKLLIAAFIITAYILKKRSVSLKNTKTKYHKLRDDTMEISLQLKKQNKELLEKQNYEINLATVTERNRIAKDIHDNVGHLLSRSILQVGALLAVDKNEKTQENLKLIKNSLSEAMDSIRASVHNLHEKSIDLQAEVHKLTDSFNLCPIKFNYEMETNPEKDIKYCFIAVIKEALSNIMKHSNADKVSLLLHEHPGFYQLVIHDNGTNIDFNHENGIGIKNIEDRVAALDGNINISTDMGFRIFISIPKKPERAE